MAKEFQTTHTKKALGRVDEDAIIAESLEHLFQVLLVFLFGRSGNKDIVYVIKAKMQSTQDLVHKTLEGLASIAQTKWHADKPKWRGNSSYGDVRWFDGYLVVCTYKVKFGKYGFAVE